jgi:hypothetical protein
MVAFTESCNSQKACSPCPGSPSLNPNIEFILVDSTTGQNLFFGAGAKYAASDIKIHHYVNGKPDTAYLTVHSDSQSLNLNVATIHAIDTVVFQIANQQPDIFLFSTSSSNKCCPLIKQLNSVSFDGTTVYSYADRSKIVTIKK